MTLKQRVTEELLGAVNDSAGLKEVFRLYAHSKGPLYGALGEATAELRRLFDTARREVAEASNTYSVIG